MFSTRRPAWPVIISVISSAPDFTQVREINFIQISFHIPQKIKMRDVKTGYVFHSPPLRHRSSKWYVSLAEYPYHLWPPYVTAGAYILSRQTLLDLHYGSQFTQYFRFDDVFLGLVARKARIEPVHCPQFYFWKKPYSSSSSYRHVIASHGYSDPDELKRVWSEQKSAGNA